MILNIFLRFPHDIVGAVYYFVPVGQNPDKQLPDLLTDCLPAPRIHGYICRIRDLLQKLLGISADHLKFLDAGKDRTG